MIKNIRIWLLKRKIKANEYEYKERTENIVYTAQNIDYINKLYAEMNRKNLELIKKIKRLGG